MERETKLNQLRMYEEKFKDLRFDLQEVNAINMTLKADIEDKATIMDQGDRIQKYNKALIENVASEQSDRNVRRALHRYRNFTISQKIEHLSYDEMSALNSLSGFGLSGVVVKYFRKDPFKE